MNGKVLLPVLTALLLLAASSVIVLSGKDDRARITVFGIGEADCILIQHHGENMLIDTGEKKNGEAVVDKLAKLGVKRLDYLILTHPDKDHIGGAPAILSAFEVGAVYQSPFRKGSKAESALHDAFADAGLVPIVPDVEVVISVGDVRCTIDPPRNVESSNDSSLLLLATHGDVRAFFAGDAKDIRLKEALQLNLPPCHLYKVPHHGRWNDLSGEMISHITPDYAVITAKKADKEIVSAFSALQTRLLYAYKDDITLLSDGKALTALE